MDEMTNQSIDSEELDFEIEEINDSPDEVEEEEPSVDETDTAPTDDFSLNIRYNGQDQTLTREEATTLAQKGMNYDKINERLQQALNNPVLKIIESNAKRAGMSVEDYANRMAQFQDNLNIQNIAKEFKAKNPDVSDEVASQYANEVYKNQISEMNRREAEQTRQSEEAEHNALVAEVQAFQQRFPDVDLEKLPVEVIDDINSGTPLMQAYLSYENTQLRNRLSNAQTNTKNKNSSVGKVSANVKADESDSFIQGLLG